MRKHFDGFDSAVDLEEINLVQIESATHEFTVVITTKSGARTIRRFPFHDATNLDAFMSAREEAQACRKSVERFTWWRLQFAKVMPHVWTWLASAGFTAWLTGHLSKMLEWLASKL